MRLVTLLCTATCCLVVNSSQEVWASASLESDVLYDYTQSTSTTIYLSSFEAGQIVHLGAPADLTRLSVLMSDFRAMFRVIDLRIYSTNQAATAPDTLIWSGQIGTELPSTPALFSFNIPEIRVPRSFAFTLDSGVRGPSDIDFIGVAQAWPGPPNFGQDGRHVFFNGELDVNRWISERNPYPLAARIEGNFEVVPEPSAAVIAMIVVGCLVGWKIRRGG